MYTLLIVGSIIVILNAGAITVLGLQIGEKSSASKLDRILQVWAWLQIIIWAGFAFVFIS